MVTRSAEHLFKKDDDIVRYQWKHWKQLATVVTHVMNSLYGATANRYFLYYISEMAEAITTSGQLSILYSEKTINNYLNNVLKTDNIDYVSYVDTDSNYVNMAPLVKKVFGTTDIDNETGEKFLDKVSSEKLEPAIEEGYKALAEQMGAYRNAMSMKREKITNKTIFCVHPESKIFDGSVTIEDAYNKKMFGQTQSYNIPEMTMEDDICLGVNRKWFKGELIVITTESGNTLKLTPDHLVLVKRNGKSPIWKRADELSESDELFENTQSK